MRRMRFACLITGATDAPSQYVIRTAFPRQQWLRERASMLRYAYTLFVLYCIDIVNLKSRWKWRWKYIVATVGYREESLACIVTSPHFVWHECTHFLCRPSCRVHITLPGRAIRLLAWEGIKTYCLRQRRGTEMQQVDCESITHQVPSSGPPWSYRGSWYVAFTPISRDCTAWCLFNCVYCSGAVTGCEVIWRWIRRSNVTVRWTDRDQTGVLCPLSNRYQLRDTKIGKFLNS